MVQLNMNLHGVTASGTGITHSGSSSDLNGVKARITQSMDAWFNSTIILHGATAFGTGIKAIHSGLWSDLKGFKARITQGMDGSVQERFAWSM